MRKKHYKGVKCVKRNLTKCEGACKTFDSIHYAFTDLLNESEDIISFRCNVLMEGLAEGEYTSDIVATKQDKKKIDQMSSKTIRKNLCDYRASMNIRSL